MAALNGYLALGNFVNGVFTEIAASGYARQDVSFEMINETEAQNKGSAEFTKGRYFHWPRFTAYAFFKAATGGVPVVAWEARLPSDMELFSGRPRSISARELTIAIPLGYRPITISGVTRELGEVLGDVAPLIDRPLVVYVGTSLTAAGSSTLNTISNGFTAWAQTLSRHAAKFIVASNQGVSGDTTTQMKARFAAVEALKPAIVVIDAGTNDLGVDATVSTGNIAWMIKRCRAIGAKIVLLKTFPRGSVASPMTASQLKVWKFQNAWKAQQSAPDLIVVDAEDVLGANDANHTILPALTADDLHLNYKGAKLAGEKVAAAVRQIIIAGDDLPKASNDATNLVPNGFLTGTGGTLSSATGSVAAGFSGHGQAAGGATVAFSKVARTDDLGEWQQITVSGNYTGNNMEARLYRNVTGIVGLSAGDTVEAFCEVEVDEGIVGVATVGLYVQWAAGTQILNAMGPLAGSGYEAPDGPWSGQLRTMPFVLTANETALVLRARVVFLDAASSSPVAANVRFGRVGVRRVQA